MLKETLKENVKKIVSVPNLHRPARVVFLSLVSSILLAYIVSNIRQSKCLYLKIIIQNNYYCSQVADDAAERIKGLSGVKEIADNESMLFVFDIESKHGIWMKEMLVPIDIVWVSAEKKVLHIENNVSPSSYPKVYFPDKKSKFVIELKAGTAQKIKLNLGDKILW